MRKTILFHFILLFILAVSQSVVLCAQPDSVAVYQLDEALVTGERKVGVSVMQRFSVGGSAYRADSASLASFRHGSLANYIMQLTPVYIRESGNGMMSTASLRGTSASHTATQWNGLTINSLTMGQTDFSHLPIFFFDKVEIYPGGEGALYGNGAIGGSVVMETEAEKANGIRADVQQNFGSFGYSFTGGRFVIGKKLWSAKTAVMYNFCENDFPFRNTAVYGFPEERQNNASFNKFGALQEVYYRPSVNSTLSFKAWYMQFYRDIQPMEPSNNTPSAYDNISDRNLVTLVTYNHNATWAKFSISGAYLYDKQLHQNDIIATNRYTARVEAEKTLFTLLTIKAGAYVEYIVPDVYSYQSGVTEWRGDVYVLCNYHITPHWEASLNLRQSFVTHLNPPFTPSAGLGYKIINRESNQLKIRSTVSKSFRAPTLNDRYWGNPLESKTVDDLKPEIGTNIEGGLDYALSLPLFELQAQTTIYHNDVDDWIQWIPRGQIWKPTNLQEVSITGVEFGAKLSTKIDKLKLTASGNYAHAFSKIVKSTSAIVSPYVVGKQLPLMPQNRWNALFEAEYSKAFIQYAMNYTDESYSTDVDMKVDAYTLANVTAGYRFMFGKAKHTLILQARIDNLFDKEYQSIMFYAMPGRSWNASLRYIFN